MGNPSLERKSAMPDQEGIRWNWLRFMYGYTVVVAGGCGAAMIISPSTVQSLFRLPNQDALSFAIVGSVYLAFGLSSLLGLRDPLRFVPILLLQLNYKIIWFAGFFLPQSLTGQFPPYGILIAILFASYVIGDLIAIPFSYLLSNKS
jgi:hypothetical protein